MALDRDDGLSHGALSETLTEMEAIIDNDGATRIYRFGSRSDLGPLPQVTWQIQLRSCRENSALAPLRSMVIALHPSSGFFQSLPQPLLAWRSKLEEQTFARQRAIQERHLPPIGARKHLVTHLPKQKVDLKAGFFKVCEHGLCEWAVGT